jgi:thiaminase/transcriptional activator TenA
VTPATTPVPAASTGDRPVAADAGRPPASADRLLDALAPAIGRVRGHRFWTGLRDGTVPVDRLRRFAQQDLALVVPAYARALARCAAVAPREEHAALLAGAAAATFTSLPLLGRALDRLGRPAGTPEIRAMRDYSSFLLAAPLRPLTAAVGALLPMTLLHLHVSEVVAARPESNSYRWWIDNFRAFDGYSEYLAEFLGMVREVGAEHGWDDLITHAVSASEFEIALADSA